MLRIPAQLLVFSFVSLLLFGSPLANAAGINIKGISKDKVLSNVRAHLDGFAPPTAEYQVSLFEDNLKEKITLATQAFGYYQIRLDVRKPEQLDSQEWQVQVDLGPQTVIRQLSIEVTGQGSEDTEIQALLRSIGLSQGKALNHSAYEQAKSKIKSLALSRGYFGFTFIQSQIRVFESLNVADVTIHADSGSRHKFGEVLFGKDDRTKQLTQALLPFQSGDYYLASQLGELNQRLTQTQYFRQVIVRPLVNDIKDDSVPIEIILVHKPRDTYDIGIGAASDVGLRFTGKWQRPWVNSRGHSMGAEILLSAPEQHVSIDYRVPLSDAIQNYLSYQLGYQALNDNDTKSRMWSFTAGRYWTVENSDWQRAAYIKLEQETFTQGLELEQTTRLVTPGFTLTRLRSRGGLDISWGDKQRFSTEFASDALLSDINMVRITAASKWLRSFQQHRFLFRAELAGIVTNDFAQVPSSLRFFTGGDQSVRGFNYRTLSSFEFDAEGKRELIGGQYLSVASIEYSYPVAQSWRAAIFVDAGNAGSELFKSPAIGVGVGAIWNSPIGPVRMYLARGKSDFDNTRFFHFSMGPSL